MKDFVKKLKIYSLKNNRKKVLKNYYSKEMRKGKTFRANYLDKLLMSLFLFITLLIFLIYKSHKFFLPLYISILFIFFFSKISSSISKKLEKKKIEDINEGLKEKKLSKQFENYSREDFINSIKDLLEEYLEVEIEDGSPPTDLKYMI